MYFDDLLRHLTIFDVGDIPSRLFCLSMLVIKHNKTQLLHVFKTSLETNFQPINNWLIVSQAINNLIVALQILED